MKKRNKSPKAKGGPRGGARGGRGGSRGGMKNSQERQSNSNSKGNISTSGYSFHTSPFNISNSQKRRGGFVGATNTDAGYKPKDNHINDMKGNNGKTIGMNVNAGEAQVPNQPSSNDNPSSTNNNFYLHKKFKKVTPSVDSNELGSATNSNTNNSSFSVSVNSTDNNEVPLANGIDFDGKTDKSQIKSSNESLSSNTKTISTSAINSAAGTATTNSTSVISAISSDSQSVANSQSSSSSNSTSVVYKPKFRISTDIDVGRETTTPLSISSTPTSTVPVTQAPQPEESLKEKKLPSRIEREQRIDRQSLDDRISKIIDENQSILATWPEHLTKRLKGHGKGQQQQNSSRTNSQVVTMSGGSTTEISSSHIQNVNQTLNLSKVHNLQLPSTSSRLPCFEIPSDMDYSSNINHSSHPVHSNLIFPSSNSFAGPSTLETASDFSDSSVKDLTFANCVSSSTASMVPKKRRRLSPTPSRLCGGEVSELPVQEGPSSNKNHFQDVDMTVRVSNCGPSGAQVTIRTNNQTAGVNSSVHQSAGVDFSRLIEVPLPLPMTPPIKNSLYYSVDPYSNDKPISLSTKDDQGSVTDHKVTKGRGKSPKKVKVHNQIAGMDMTGGESIVPAADYSMRNNMKSNVNSSVIMSPKPMTYFGSSAPSPKLSISPNSDIDQGREISTEEDTEKSSLLLQSSNLNPKRPTFLALKPQNNNVTKLTEPSVLPSPDTPRGNKQYNQMCINGSAYTYLGFKVSTRSSYTCLFKAQPMFVPQDTDSKLSMYSNWQPRPADTKEGNVSLSTNDSRINGRKSPKILYTSAFGNSCDTLTVSSPVRQAPISSPVDSSKPFPGGMSLSVIPRETEAEREASPSHSETSLQIAISPISRACASPEPSWTNTRITDSKTEPVPLALVTKSNGLIRSCLSPPSNSCGSNSNSYQNLPTMNMKSSSGLSQSAAATVASFSESSSADESSSSYTRNVKKSHTSITGKYSCEQPLSLTINQNRGVIGTNELPEDSSTNFSSIHSPVVMNRFDNPRVRIMEGGFESNEDYTYVRGRGKKTSRGRYVCEACGIRCKKPSMLRKHLKTHTDLRPYTCKLCNFSFKTKGNLTKHQKSKSHHKKCSSLGIHPNSSRSLAMIGPSFSISDTNTTDDNDSDDDDDDNGVDNDDMESDSNSQDDGDTGSSPENYNENANFEKEIAQSLLDLSKMPRMPLGSQSEDSSNTNVILESNTTTERPKSQPLTFSVRAMLEEQIKAKASSASAAVPSPAPDSLEAPMDLSFKANQVKSIVAPSEAETKRAKLEKNGYVRSFGIVGEAQRWEPEEDVMLNGCLNLKKVRNSTLSIKDEKKPSIAFGETSPVSISPAPTQVPIQVDIKPEVIEFPVESKKPLELEKVTPAFGGKRKRDSSLSSNEDANYASLNVVPKTKEIFHPLPLQKDTQRSPTPPPSTSTVTTASSNTSSSSNAIPKQQKLHQPWLSSPEAKEKGKEAESTPPTVPASVPPAQSSPPAAAVLAAEAFSPKLPPAPVVKPSPEREIDVGVNEPVLVSSEEPPTNVSSPNSSIFPPVSLKPQAEFRQPSGAQALVKDEGKAECNVCGKSFSRASQLTLHMNIHYLERPFRCDPCGVSFRTKGHLIKHRRSSSHDCKVYLTEAWGVANEENPRPFKCPDCKIAFRIHGHLAKHLRSKMHIMRMECLGKLPFGIYFEMEKSGMNLNEIDTTDCDMSLVSLQNLARKIYGENWMERLTAPTEEPA